MWLAFPSGVDSVNWRQFGAPPRNCSSFVTLSETQFLAGDAIGYTLPAIVPVYRPEFDGAWFAL
jgi:hypothetical protein